ncbi:hypothetical protein EPN96_04005 [bacterium]|nr:MAG: hypothetical protein EPN96_04005 [bacterium]
MNRYKTFGLHLLISAVLITAISALFVFWWFPPPFLYAEGGWRALRIIACVDATVGPLLTLIVCNPKKAKKVIIKDLAFIGALQLAAMSWGLWSIYGQRTVAVVGSDGTFYSIEADNSSAATKRAGELGGGHKPAYVVLDLPRDLNERQKIRFESMQTKIPIYNFDRYYVPLGKEALEELAYSEPKLEKMVPEGPAGMDKVKAFLGKKGRAREDFFIFPVQARDSKFIIFIDRKEGTVAGWLHDIETGKDY